MDQPIASVAVEEGPRELTEVELARLDAFGQSLSKTLKEAIDARKASGIEQIWREDEEHYEGIDDKNRGYGESQWATKAPSTGSRRAGAGNQSIVFPNITRPYVDAAAAKIVDIILPTDDRPWSLTETPVPELVDMAKGILPKAVKESMAAAGTDPQTQQNVLMVEQQRASMMIEESKAKARKAETRIEDWQVEGQYHAEMRRVIDDMCRIGTGVLKGPIPTKKKLQKWDSKTGTITALEEVKPVSKRIDPWNFYPAAGCGESIHNGNAVWERDFLSQRKLEELKKEKGYLPQAIDKCIEEGPAKKTEMRTTADGKIVDDGKLFEVYYGYCFAEREDVEAAGCECEKGFVSIPVIVTLVNGRVIKVALNPLDDGCFPFDLIPYQRKVGMPWGTSVSRQMRTPQQIVVAGTRTMLTNAGRAAGPVFVMKNNVEGANGSNNIEPWAIFYASEDDSTDDARKFIAMHVIPDLQQSLMNIIQFGMKLAEDVTGMPLLLQGQPNRGAPDTLGGQQLQDRNASGVLRRIARTVDDCITEPHTRRYYTWLLKYGEDEEKGEFVLDARGSTALVEKDLYKQELVQLLQASLNPAFGLSPAKIMAETLRITKRSPADLQLSDEEKQAQAQAQQGQQPQDNSMAVAKIRAETEMGKAQLNQTSDMKELEFKAAEAQKDRDHQSRMAMLERDVAMMKFANERGMTLEQVKADLAKTVMSLRVQRELNGTEAAQPAIEPKGLAPDGQSFAK